MPTKNEEWILPTTLAAASQFADHIIVADQNSTDKTRELLDEFEKVEWFTNDEQGHSNKVRWKMLDYLREKYGHNNLVLCIDADEIFPPHLFNKYKDRLLTLEPGTTVVAPWVQVWNSIRTYRDDDSVWNPKTNTKPFMFVDKPDMDYERTFVINDHTARIPMKNSGSSLTVAIPLLHFQFVSWERSQMKQAWYRCKELVAGGNATSINQKYRNSSNIQGIKYSPIPKGWYADIDVSTTLEACEPANTWHFREMVEMFDKHGIEKFRELEIWNWDCLKNLLK